MSKQVKHILLIGPRTNLKKNLIGGATISFDLLVKECKTYSRCSVINTQKFGSSILNVLNLVLQCIFILPSAQIVIFNSSRGGMTKMAPLILSLSRLFGVKCVLRPFGGNFTDYMSKSDASKKVLDQIIHKADLILLQTNHLINQVSQLGGSTYYLSTSRNNPPSEILENKQPGEKLRLIYLGAINETKGIDLLTALYDQCHDQFDLKIMGPIKEGKYHRLFETRPGLYGGTYDASHVYQILSQQDILIFPTQYEGEGYPGVIIESFACGIPVITTAWRSIPEIVEDGVNGLLMDSYDVNSIKHCLDRLDDIGYSSLSQNARLSFLERFESGHVHQALFRKLETLV